MSESHAFIPPSIDKQAVHAGRSYTWHSQSPAVLDADKHQPCVMGIDEAGRGPVLGMWLDSGSHTKVAYFERIA